MPEMKIEECIEVVGRINNDLFEGRSEALSAFLRILEAYKEAVEALKKAKEELERQLYKTKISQEKDILSAKIGTCNQALAIAKEFGL